MGDVDFAGVSEVAGRITPVPGGVGPLTVAMLLNNTLLAAKMQRRDFRDLGIWNKDRRMRRRPFLATGH